MLESHAAIPLIRVIRPGVCATQSCAADFKKIPGSPIAYWLEGLGLFEESKIGDLCVSGGRNKTHNDKLFVRMFWEVETPSSRWVEYANGGEFRKYCGNEFQVVDWSDAARRSYAEQGGLCNEKYWGKEGITWSLITSALNSFRIKRSQSQYSSGSPTIFNAAFLCDKKALAFLNSPIARYYLKALNPTLNTTVGDVFILPYVHGRIPDEVIERTERCVCISKADWDADERSRAFERLPLVQASSGRHALFDCYNNLQDRWRASTLEMMRLEKDNNSTLIGVYGLKSVLTSELPLEEITLTCNPVYRYGPGKTDEEYEQLQRADTMKELISYAVGCMMGRYSPDTPGLQFAGGTYDHDKACAAAPSFHPDADGILPVLAEAYFEDDLTARFTEFLKATFGKDHLSENLRFVAEAIGIKGSESPQDAIRRFLANDFFKYHMRMYKKRPIYWLFSSGKEKAFQALVCLHRYTPSTLARMRTGYLHELQNKLRARIEDMEAGKDAATSTAQANRINRDLTKLRKQLEELRVFDEKLHHYADQRIEIDLDDGVKHNYGLFGDLLAEVKDVTGDKA